MEFDLTPDPKIYIALTHTPMQPLDALCELIDNSIDSFHEALSQGAPVEHPLVVVGLPKPAEVRDGKGVIRIQDNGPGMSAEMAEKAIKAGYSGNNPFDRLGLFGMGFNISTGKLGRRTRFVTTRATDSTAIEVIIDLVNLQESRSFAVPVRTIEKPFDSGTLIDIGGWWPEGSANAGFVRRLVSYGLPKIREELGRRYGTVLRGDTTLQKKVRLDIAGALCEAFEHCHWQDSRYVERRGGRVPAVIRFDEIVHSQVRCLSCNELVENGDGSCPACHGSSLRTIHERIKGWVGVQRFDDETNFGVDLIRNGRTIRPGEKAAFFEFTNEFKKTIKDYPIDQQYGRIVGEVHLNHVPVDFMKEDFQRTSSEWQRAMSYLRGDSSLQPNQPGADSNTSPVYRIFQGYRRVRRLGKGDMYMGFWADKSKDDPQRVSRQTERDYYEKFLQRVPGYYDDEEWWKLVEQADQKPAEEMVECPACQAQNRKGLDTCQLCGSILQGKKCVSCKQEIALSATSCPFCGNSQVPEVVEPWICKVCGHQNQMEDENCDRCSFLRGTPDLLSATYLSTKSNRDDSLSISGCSVELADGSFSHPISVDVFAMAEPIRAFGSNKELAIRTVIGENSNIELFIDKNHPLFRSYRLPPQHAIAHEVASYLFDTNRRLVTGTYQGLHSVAQLGWAISQKYYGSSLIEDAESVREDARRLFTSLRERLASKIGSSSADIYNELSPDQEKVLVSRMLDNGIDLGKLSVYKQTGEFIRFLDESTLVSIFMRYPELFFDGTVWTTSFGSVPDLAEQALQAAQVRIKRVYGNCIEDCAAYLTYPNPSATIIRRTRASIEYLQGNLAE